MDRYISRFYEDNTYSFLNDNYGSAEVYPSAHIRFYQPFWISLENISNQSVYY